MKKILMTLLIFCLLFGLSACEDENYPNVKCEDTLGYKMYSLGLMNFYHGNLTVSKNGEFLPFQPEAFALKDYILGYYLLDQICENEGLMDYYDEIDQKVQDIVNDKYGGSPLTEAKRYEAAKKETVNLLREHGIEIDENKLDEYENAARETEIQDAYYLAEDRGWGAYYEFGFKPTDVIESAFSIYHYNDAAYCIGVFIPVEGAENKILKGLNAYKELQMSTPGNSQQKEIIGEPVVETLESGEIVIVMVKNSPAIFSRLCENLAE